MVICTLENLFYTLSEHFIKCCSLDFLQTLLIVVCQNPRRSALSEILKSPYLAPTIIPHQKVT